MADQQIPDLTFDPANSNVARDDLVLIHRNNVDYKARFTGALLLPSFTSTDANKVLQVNSTGTAASWQPSERQRWELIGQPLTRSAGNTGDLSPWSVTGLSNYRDFYLNITAGDGTIHGIELRYGTFVSYSSDGSVTAWFSNNFTQIHFEINGTSNTIRQVHLYARA